LLQKLSSTWCGISGGAVWTDSAML
jgi:hypothetical protein